MTELVTLYAAPELWLQGLNQWLGLLIAGLRIMALIGLGGWILAKAGRSPLWILALLVPYLSVLAVWVFAYTPWPVQGGAVTARSHDHDADPES